MSKLMTYRSVSHLFGTPTYRSWRSMVERCMKPSHKDFPHYGARGITVCSEWLDLANFVRDVGLRPNRSLTLDRIDNKKGYEPGNCRWATAKQQQRNKGNNYLVTIDGEQRCLADVCDERGLPYELVYNRLYYGGWSIEEALAPQKLRTRCELSPAQRSVGYHNRTFIPTNKHGFTGVEAQGNGFIARIRVNGAKRYLGRFQTAEEAHAAYVVAKGVVKAGGSIQVGGFA